MKRTVMNSDEPYLPLEIIRSILKRLPVKSLIRCQCVCKLWKNLIKNPSFIAEHLQHSSCQNPSLILQCSRIFLPPRLWRAWSLRLLDCDLQVREVKKAPLIDSLESARIVGSCNGLLLFETKQNNKLPLPLLLWNPATTAVRHVPISTTDCFDFYNCRTGFGFSPIVNDYMIVRTGAELHDSVSRVEVFSLRRGAWKGMGVGNLEGVKLGYKTVTAGGAIFWSGVKLGAKEGVEDGVGVIVSFDIVKEVFTLIPMPNVDYDTQGMLTVYENKLAILCDFCEDGYWIDLWVLNEGSCASGKTWGWTKRYTGNPFPGTSCALTMWRNEIVGKVCLENVFYSMNLTTNEVKRFVIPCDGIVNGPYDYVESLVSVGNSFNEEF